MFSYDENGNLKGSMQMKPPVPKRLQWEFKEELVKNIDEAYQDALKIVQVKDRLITFLNISNKKHFFLHRMSIILSTSTLHLAKASLKLAVSPRMVLFKWHFNSLTIANLTNSASHTKLR